MIEFSVSGTSKELKLICAIAISCGWKFQGEKRRTMRHLFFNLNIEGEGFDLKPKHFWVADAIGKVDKTLRFEVSKDREKIVDHIFLISKKHKKIIFHL